VDQAHSAFQHLLARVIIQWSNQRHRYRDAQLEIKAPERFDCGSAAKVRGAHRGQGQAEQLDQALL
jgi:hypothetical protein